MTNNQADALGCSLWLFASGVGVIAGVYAGNWAVGEVDSLRWVAWGVAFLVVSSVLTPAVGFASIFLVTPFLKEDE